MDYSRGRSERFGRLILAVTVFCGTGLTAAAQERSSPAALRPERGTLALPGGTRNVGAMLDEFTSKRRTKALLLDAATNNLLFPVLGKIPGWRSDVMLINYKSTAQRVAFLFLEQGINNANGDVLQYTLPANSPTYWHDFVGTALGIGSGLGSVIILGVDSQGNIDTSASLDGSARLYQTDASGGSLSQMFPSVPLEDVPSGSQTTAIGLRSDPQYRTNAGVVNTDSVAHTFTVTIVGASVSSFQINALPYSMMQVRIPNDGTHGDVALQFTSNSGYWWSAYGATADNISGDSWSAHAALAY